MGLALNLWARLSLHLYTSYYLCQHSTPTTVHQLTLCCTQHSTAINTLIHSASHSPPHICTYYPQRWNKVVKLMAALSLLPRILVSQDRCVFSAVSDTVYPAAELTFPQGDCRGLFPPHLHLCSVVVTAANLYPPDSVPAQQLPLLENADLGNVKGRFL